MALLFHVNGGGRAYCPLYFANPIIEKARPVDIQCNSQCAWCIPHYKNNGDPEYYTCVMNDREDAAMKVVE